MWTEGKKLREKRESQRLSAADLAEIFGATKENVYKWETGTKPMSKVMRKKVLDYINDKVSVNGTVPYEDYKTKYYTLLEKYTALLEKK